MQVRSGILRGAASLLCLCTTLAVAGCNQPPTAAADYRMQHRVYAQEKVFNLILPLPASGRLSAALHRNKIENFASDYLRRGHGPILVSRYSRGNGADFSKSMIAGALFSTGVPEQRVYFQVLPDTKNNAQSIELSYSGYVAHVPRCGDWSGQTGFDPSNLPHTDFGCSFQRNTGLMISNPGDLSVAGGGIQYDTPNSDRVIKTYRKGEQLGTPLPTNEQKEFSEVK